MNALRTLAIAVALSTTTLAVQAQQQPDSNIHPNSAGNQSPTRTDYSKEQLLTSTVHQAWLLSGKNESNFFDMVQQLAEISATNRGLTLPDSAAAGRRMGEYIKRQSKLDTDQLLYAVVDKAVVFTTHAPAHPAKNAQPAQPVQPVQ